MRPGLSLFSTALIAAVITATSALVSARAEGDIATKPEPVAQKTAACPAPSDLSRLILPLARTARQLAAGLPITIVAIGSSSTAGAGASSEAASYPSRLAVELKDLMPRASFKVINRGINGETAREMVARFDADVFAEKPDVVIWQVGSNSVLRDQPLSYAGSLVRDGLKRLKAAGIDVILMNPQYAPKVLAKRDADRMVDLIDQMAKEAGVDLFQRFALMRYWRLTENIPFDTFVSADELHLNDWSYGCVAKALAGAMIEAATRPTVTAGARR